MSKLKNNHRRHHAKTGDTTRVWLLGMPETALVVEHHDTCPACYYVQRHCIGTRQALLIEAEDGRRWKTSVISVLGQTMTFCAYTEDTDAWPLAEARAGAEIGYDDLTLVRGEDATIATVDGRALCRATEVPGTPHVRLERLDGVTDTITSISSDDAGEVAVALANNHGRPTADVFEWMTTRAREARTKEPQ